MLCGKLQALCNLQSSSWFPHLQEILMGQEDFHNFCKNNFWLSKRFTFLHRMAGFRTGKPVWAAGYDTELCVSQYQGLLWNYSVCSVKQQLWNMIWGFVYRKREGKGIANYILLDANLEWDSKKITFLHFWSKVKCMAAVLQHTSSLGAFCNCQCGVKTVMGFVMFLPSCDAENTASVFLCCFNLSPV